jgi:type I pantothenate kinase
VPSSSPALTPSPYARFSAAEWAALRQDTPLTLTEEEVVRLRGRGERVSLAEVERIYLPLSRLLNLYVAATQELFRASSEFLGARYQKVTYIIGVAGSVAVGKSTTARLLRELLARWSHHPKVDLITTDGFLYPNRVLSKRNLMQRKGFPESYDTRALLRFLSAVKAGERCVTAPVYSHAAYDIVDGELTVVDQPDILIVEGLNVLQTGRPSKSGQPEPIVADYFDFSVFLDAEESVLQQWYIERFLTLRQTAFRDPMAYFHRYAALDEGQAMLVAKEIWENINLANLRQNILPTRPRARLILHKAADHSIDEVWLRKL